MRSRSAWLSAESKVPLASARPQMRKSSSFATNEPEAEAAVGLASVKFTIPEPKFAYPSAKGEGGWSPVG